MTNETRPTGPGQTSLMDQFGQTRASFGRLFRAHVDLFKAEIGDILNQVKTMAGLAGAALAILLMVGNLLYVGGFLFMGEWLFGSMGWGLAHGVLFGIGIIVALGLGIVGARASAGMISFLIAAVITMVLALALGSNVLSNAVSNVAGQLASPFNSNGLIAAVAGAIVLAIVFMLIFARIGGRSGAIGGFFAGAMVGLLLGWIAAGAQWTWPPAVGFAITIGLISWPILNFALAWPGINMEERFGNLYPRQSIEAVNETKAWLEEQWQTRRPMRGSK